MRLNEILDEAPLGAIKKAGLGIASKFSSKASGKLAMGKEANEIKKDFNFFVGSSNQSPTARVLMNFLKQENHPTDSANNILKSELPSDDALSNAVIDQVLSAVAQDAFKSGKVKSTSSSQNSNQSNPSSTGKKQSTSSGSRSVPQVASDLDQMSNDEKKAILKHLKTTDTYNELGL
jgi:hypothetical protein